MCKQENHRKPQKIRDHETVEGLMKKYMNQLWMNGAKEDLPWPSFDSMMKGEVKNDFENMMVAWEKGYSLKLKRGLETAIHLTQGRKRNANKLITS